MPRKAGSQNYKKEVLLEVVATFLPQGSNSWEQVAAAYKEKSGEGEVRGKEDLRRHWGEKCCNKFKTPTDQTGAANEFIFRCQRVQDLIHKKNESSLLGAGSDSSSDSDEGEDPDSSWLENQQTNLLDKTTATVLSVAVNPPSDDAAAAEEGGGDLVNGAGNVSLFSQLSKHFYFISCKLFTNVLSNKLVIELQQVILLKLV